MFIIISFYLGEDFTILYDVFTYLNQNRIVNIKVIKDIKSNKSNSIEDKAREFTSSLINKNSNVYISHARCSTDNYKIIT